LHGCFRPSDRASHLEPRRHIAITHHAPSHCRPSLWTYNLLFVVPTSRVGGKVAPIRLASWLQWGVAIGDKTGLMGLRETAGSFFTSPLPLLPGHVEVHIVWFSDTGLCVTGALGFAVAHHPVPASPGGPRTPLRLAWLPGVSEPGYNSHPTRISTDCQFVWPHRTQLAESDLRRPRKQVKMSSAHHLRV